MLLAWKVFILLFAFFLMSCGPAHHLRRAEKFKERMDRQIDKAIAKGAEVKRDTIFKEIPVVVKEVKTDTVFQEKQVGDTITIEKERLTIKYVKLPGDSVYIEGECEADTVILKVPVATNAKFETKPLMKWWQFAGWILLALVAGLTIGKLTK